jgi:hypothetical protein
MMLAYLYEFTDDSSKAEQVWAALGAPRPVPARVAVRAGR